MVVRTLQAFVYDTSAGQVRAEMPATRLQDTDAAGHGTKSDQASVQIGACQWSPMKFSLQTKKCPARRCGRKCGNRRMEHRTLFAIHLRHPAKRCASHARSSAGGR